MPRTDKLNKIIMIIFLVIHHFLGLYHVLTCSRHYLLLLFFFLYFIYIRILKYII